MTKKSKKPRKTRLVQKPLRKGSWHDPAADRFATAGDAVALLEQLQEGGVIFEEDSRKYIG